MNKFMYLMAMIALLMLGSVQAAPSAPPVTSGLVMHFSADSIDAADGQSIGTWSDLSGNGNDAVQATADNQPTYVIMNPDFKGHPTLHFDGSNDYLNLPSGASCPITVDNFTLFVVAKFDDDVNTNYLIGGDTGTNRLRIIIEGDISGDPFAWRIGDMGWTALNTASDTDPHVFGANSNSGNAEGFVDGVSAGTASTGSSTGSPNAFHIGASGGGGNNFVGDVAEFVLYNTSLSTEDTAAVSEYLEKKYLDDVLSATNPLDGEVGVPEGDVTLQWDGAEDPANPGQLDPNVLKHYVYMDTDNTDDDPNLYYIGEVAGSTLDASYGPIAFSKNQKVNWQVREGLDDGTGSAYLPGDPNNWLWGPVWTFDMELTVPQIDSITPESQVVALGSDPNITVAGQNIDYYAWYKDDDPDPLTDDGKYSGTETATLTINDVEIADEGTYTCVVTNDESTEEDSASSYLLVARLVSWWKLDGDPNDSVQQLVPGAPEFDGAPIDSSHFTAGNGLDGGDSAYFEEGSTAYPSIRIDGTEDYFNFYDKGLTVNAWIKSDYSGGTWPPVVAKRDSDGDGWCLFLDGDKQVSARMAGSSLYGGGPALNDGEWHMITMTYDGTTMAIYADGEPVDSDPYGSDADINAAAISFGEWANDGDPISDFDGNIDDIKIFNYALTFEEIFNEYVTFKPGEWICQETAAMQYDSDDNCVIDLTDFAAWAATWLACDRYPESDCP